MIEEKYIRETWYAKGNAVFCKMHDEVCGDCRTGCSGREIKIADDFPFYLMTDAEVQTFNPAEGAELTLRTRNAEAGQPDTIRRRIYAIRRIPARAAKKYSGDTARRNVCFIPEVYDK